MSCYQLGCWRFESTSGELTCGRCRRRLEPIVAEVLTLLASRSGEVVSRRDILDAVWRDRVVVDESVTRCICLIRAALSDDRPYRLIETLPKRGYRVRATWVPCPSHHGAFRAHAAAMDRSRLEHL